MAKYSSLKRRVKGLAGVATAGAEAGLTNVTTMSKPPQATQLPTATTPAPISFGGVTISQAPQPTGGAIFGTSPYSYKAPATGVIQAPQVQTGPPTYLQWGRGMSTLQLANLRKQYGDPRLSKEELYKLETDSEYKRQWEEARAAKQPDPYAEMYERIQSLLEETIGKYETSAEESRRANIDRYEDILSRRGELIESTMKDVEGYGTAEQEEIERQYAKESAKIGANLAARGLSSTSIGPALQMGLARRKVGSLAQLRERTGMMRAKLRGGLTEEMLRFMERREDEAPDLGQIAQLLRRIGAGTLPQLLKKA